MYSYSSRSSESSRRLSSRPLSSSSSSSSRQSTVPDPILLVALILLCAVIGTVDIFMHMSLDEDIEYRRVDNWRTPSAQSENNSDNNNNNNSNINNRPTGFRHPQITAQQQPQPANVVPSVLPPMDLGNDESNRIKNTLRRAGVPVDKKLESQLPSWSEMTSLYGANPVILGLDRCEYFRQARAKPSDAMIGPAGMFNSGTNFLEQMLYLNCKIPGSTIRMNGMRRNVPWGKHQPPSYRLKFDAETDGGVSHTDTLPAVMVKDPFTWLSSMCRHPYAAYWPHAKDHCPNLVTKDNEDVPVTVNYHKDMVTHHTSLVGLWNDWYGAYYDAPWPRLIIRYEDLLFYPEYVVTKVCQCAGGKIKHENLQFMSHAAKGGRGHEGSSGMAEAVLKYGKAENRLVGFTERDKSFTLTHVKRDLMSAFNYSYPAENPN